MQQELVAVGGAPFGVSASRLVELVYRLMEIEFVLLIVDYTLNPKP
jgi:hypothetical protein